MIQRSQKEQSELKKTLESLFGTDVFYSLRSDGTRMPRKCTAIARTTTVQSMIPTTRVISEMYFFERKGLRTVHSSPNGIEERRPA